MTWIDDITLDELEADPYPIWARLRREAPVAFVPAVGGWFVTRRDDVIATRRMRQIGVATALPRMERTLGMPNVLMVDGPAHTDLRAAIDPLLLPKAVPTYAEDLIRPIAATAVRALPKAGEVELMETFELVSCLAVGRLVGLDVDGPTLRRWFQSLAGGIANLAMHPGPFDESDQAVREMRAAVDPLLDRLEHEPDGGMLAHMLHAGRPPGDPRPRAHIYSSILVVIAGGAQEPGHLAGTTVHGLLGRPGQMRRVLADPGLIPRAMDEALRWEAMLPIVDRQADSDLVLGGREIAEGDLIEVCVGSANRDEEHVEHPDVFDLDRDAPAHLSFGIGAHVCAGRNFGREVARITLDELTARYARLDPVAEKPVRVRGFTMRAPKELYVSVTAR
ncbi:cytochrome P450 [Spongiactinospora sp. 9N601]|uniref:cytochrome P450 n=1 Tax=Spongiactinospora sp. 9N601 TaxID=3375149 RepID=UPI003798F29D